ncbi:hypothetical protein NONI108955_21155 [Nocardia ninae]|uniref:Uncharacterized protein n=1 Tax=Nocardia ninae NBRC 108245 TaxID=1210091 RepID=A0A511M9X8_9NOCA|nr:hypothetical protein [Nocardia ninae]GEM37463.1 hypothetical protein NN4_19820 [Nocardia ninae NBRC 108245]
MTHNVRVGRASIPTTRDLVSAMSGRIPKDHPGVDILRAAFMISTRREWMQPFNVETEDDTDGMTMLNDLGIYCLEECVTTPLKDAINRSVGHPDIGSAVARLADAFAEYARSGGLWGVASHSSVAELTWARFDYTKLRRLIYRERNWVSQFTVATPSAAELTSMFGEQFSEPDTGDSPDTEEL